MDPLETLARDAKPPGVGFIVPQSGVGTNARPGPQLGRSYREALR